MRLMMTALLLLSVGPILAEDNPEARILRYPDIHGDKITFSYAGDIYLVDADGGTARRLTSHVGQELFPRFSPDGKHIAFSGEYGGNRQVYVIGVNGGVPKQLTWYNDVGPMPPRGGFDNQVLDWTPDGKHVLFRGNRLPWGVRMGRYYTVPVDGGLETALDVPEAGTGMFSPDGKKVVYTPIAREFRTWKRHRGGRAQDVWVYDLEGETSLRLTDHIMTDNQPVWVGDSIYFTSDRNFTLNLFKIAPTGGEPVQVTQHKDFDVLWPSAGPKRIVYEHAGFIRRFDPASGEDVKISVQVYGDFQETMPRVRALRDFVEGADISPTAKRVAVAARGDIFTLPAEHGAVRQITRGSNARDRDVAWSPDGRHLAYWSDADGTYQLYVADQSGEGEPRKVTTDQKFYPGPPVWSPDSKKIAFSDKEPKLYIVDVASGARTEVYHLRYNYFTEFSWSHDSKNLAFTKGQANGFSSIWNWDLEAGTETQLTSSYINSNNPAFSPDGKYLYFVSSRDMNLEFSSWEFEYLYNNSDRIYVATLRPDVANPLAARSDEETPKEPEAEAPKEEAKDEGKKKKGKKGKKAKKDEDKPKAEEAKPTLVADGFESRVFVLPMSAGSYGNLIPTKDGLMYASGGSVHKFTWSSRSSKEVMARVGGFSLSADEKKILYFSRGSLMLAPASPGAKGKALNMNDMKSTVDPKAEWAQIYRDAALIISDWFYDGNMHGYDWDALVAKYKPMADAAMSRADLDYVLGELGGELVAGHYYVNSGDYPSVTRHNNGLLGAEIVAHESGYYQIESIMPGENWHPNFRSPLREVGVNVNAGDFILAVDGVAIKTDENFYRSLEHKGDKLVTLTVNDKPSMEGARHERVRTVTRETNLRYLAWTQERMEMVTKLSNGRIGYLHMPNTAVDGNRELFKHFYAQMDKDAMIFDARYNGGGFIPFSMIRLIDRPVFSYWARRGIEPFRTPGYAHVGPKATLMNHYSSSGGDAFPYYFRERGLGKLFGTRTWGGLIGLSGGPGFVDGGSLSVPMFRFYDEDGVWQVENEGVAPDVEVYDTPHLVAKGEDPTLEAAIKHLLEELEKNPPKAPVEPKAPDESKLP